MDKQTIRWSKELGIRQVTIYAFSIENFKRDQEEVDLLMEMAAEKFGQLLFEADRLKKDQICVRFFGNLELLPIKLQRMIGELMLLTRSHQKSFLNVCLAYTSRHEIAKAVDRLMVANKTGSLLADEIDADLISHCLETRQTPNPDILIRTSGEIRFSDFLLWQTNQSQLIFTNVLWPECKVYDFFRIIVTYQLQMHFQSLKPLSLVRPTTTTGQTTIDSTMPFTAAQCCKEAEIESCDSGNGTEDSGSDSTPLNDNVHEHIDRMHVAQLQRMRVGHSLQRPPPHSETS